MGGREGDLLGSCSDRLATASEEGLLSALRQELRRELATAPAFPELVGDRRLLRTLRASRHNVLEAAEAFRAHLQKRQEFGLDAIRGHIADRWGDRLGDLPLHELPEGHCVCKYVPQVMPFAYTPKGDPVSLQTWELWRMAEYVREVGDWREKFTEHACYQLEARALLLDRMSLEQERLAHIVNVHDLRNWSLTSHFDSTFVTFQKDEMLPLAATYHDLSSHVFFINTSRWFHIPYNVFFPLLPRSTQEKILLLGEDFPESPKLREELGVGILASLARGVTAAGPRRQARTGPAREGPRGSSLTYPQGCAPRAYFGLVAARAGADVELQSWLHTAILEPLAGQQSLDEFRLLWAASLSAARTSTVLVFELSMPQAWLAGEDPDVERWQQRLSAGGIRLIGPEQTAAEVTRRAHAAVGQRSMVVHRWDGLPWLSALEGFGVAILVQLVLLVACAWLSL